MFNLTKFKLQIKKYGDVFADVLGNIELEKIENSKLIFKDELSREIIAPLSYRKRYFKFKNRWLQSILEAFLIWKILQLIQTYTLCIVKRRLSRNNRNYYF